MKKVCTLLLFTGMGWCARAQHALIPPHPAVQSVRPPVKQKLPSAKAATETALFVYNHLYERKPRVEERQMEKLSVTTLDDDHPIASQIACDGSHSTTFKLLATGASSWDIRLQENDAAKYGQLESRRVSGNGDSLVFEFAHPRYFGGPDLSARNYKIHLEVYRNGSKVATLPVRIVRPALVMVHGIFGSPATFELMATQFTRPPNYMYESVQADNSQYIKDGRLVANYKLLMGNIERVIRDCYDGQKISSAKVDLVCHSMGGLISRKYLNSKEYQKDVDKLITLNTPHSGSQICNLLLHPTFTGKFDFIIQKLQLGNINNGAVDDMRVDSYAIKALKDDRKAMNPVPMHVLGSFLDPQFLKPYMNANISNEDNGLWTPVIKTAASILTRSAELFVNEIYNGESHDIAVPTSSQDGGFTQFTVNNLQNILHPGSASNQQMIDLVKTLLNSDPNGNLFALSSQLNPPDLQLPDFLQVNQLAPSGGYPSGRTGALAGASVTSTVSVDSVRPAATSRPGDTVRVYVSGSSDVTKIALLAGGATSSIYMEEQAGHAGVFRYVMPQDAIGSIQFIAIGYNDGGWGGIGTSQSPMVMPASPLSGLSASPARLLLRAGYKDPLVINGMFQDGIQRNITELAGITYSYKSNKVVVSSPGMVQGLKTGNDTIVISYQGNSVVVPVTVLDPPFKGNGLLVSVKAFLEGPYNSTNGMMSDSLRVKSLLPTQEEPYAALGFSDIGNTTQEYPADGIFDSTNSKAMTDWVRLELRSSLNPATILATRSALLRRDGSVVDMDGTSPVYFNDVPAASYYIALRHRNHLGVMTATALALNATTPVTVDFTSSGTPTYGTNARRNLNGVMVLWGGDVNGDGIIRYNGASNDKNTLLAFVGLQTSNNVVSGYNRSDINLDGRVRYNGAGNDKNVILNAVGLTTPNNVITEQIAH